MAIEVSSALHHQIQTHFQLRFARPHLTWAIVQDPDTPHRLFVEPSGTVGFQP